MPWLSFAPKELARLLDEGVTPIWAARASGASILLAWVAGLGVWLFRRGGHRWQLTAPVAAAVATWAIFLLVHLAFGRPGFYGDRLFVILKDQADASQAISIPDRADRTPLVFQTPTHPASPTQDNLRADLARPHLGTRPSHHVNPPEG